MTWEEYSCYEDGEINDIDSKGQNGTLNIIHSGARAAIEIVTYYIKPPHLRPSKITIAGDLSSTIT
ncbi:DEHA2B16632p [Debaryomyces hansenii CBS767]|uniref:DEHA2B16632p n=1 Tax=Debaryomyces hansenii (strain ATCC 36239 / CBS 767 / BCRC 21394 / JCM 1990 / NBRC 0083 / IGC 2968) TaxID=284592 RepID=Q6BVU4_DEBHA|nr:DEHA2B16632p [Debaryomyces hansenii CBS767]CAG85689.2 DEHA2B16632p [Debaryomyces hansenii CBS767]|eukprot:XP_457675.2 DEHA2B16632p [Debaryomyces hansenii CBS767]